MEIYKQMMIAYCTPVKLAPGADLLILVTKVSHAANAKRVMHTSQVCNVY
jgi:hypothetical protein